MFTLTRTLCTLAILIASFTDAGAQPKPRIEPKSIARTLFGHARTPAPLEPAAVGFYTHGCLAGALALPMTGKTWQVMRLFSQSVTTATRRCSCCYIERLAEKGAKLIGRPFVGDMAQARAGPCQAGTRATKSVSTDIWLDPDAAPRADENEREKNSAVMVVARNRLDVDPRSGTTRTWRSSRRRGRCRGRENLRQPRDQEGTLPPRRHRSPSG